MKSLANDYNNNFTFPITYYVITEIATCVKIEELKLFVHNLITGRETNTCRFISKFFSFKCFRTIILFVIFLSFIYHETTTEQAHLCSFLLSFWVHGA